MVTYSAGPNMCDFFFIPPSSISSSLSMACHKYYYNKVLCEIVLLQEQQQQPETRVIIWLTLALISFCHPSSNGMMRGLLADMMIVGEFIDGMLCKLRRREQRLVLWSSRMIQNRMEPFLLLLLLLCFGRGGTRKIRRRQQRRVSKVQRILQYSPHVALLLYFSNKR